LTYPIFFDTVSTKNGGFVLNGPRDKPTPITLKLLIIIKGVPMTKRPVDPIHPGEILADELEVLHLNPAEVARALGVPANRMYQILSGKRAITADTALRLQQWLGVEAAFWLNLQKSYELDKAEESSGTEIRRSVHPRQDTRQDIRQEAGAAV